MCKMSFCEIWHSFSRAPIRDFLWCYYRWLITSLALEKGKKNALCLKLFWYKVFVHWKLKLLNFPVDSTLLFFYESALLVGFDLGVAYALKIW